MDAYLCIIAPVTFSIIVFVLVVSVGTSLRRFIGAAMADKLLKLDEVER